LIAEAREFRADLDFTLSAEEIDRLKREGRE
jgi:hypothetical protein